MYQLDHQYPGKSSAGRPVVVLYGCIGSASLPEFHTELKRLAEAGRIVYVLRHYGA